MAAPFPYRGGLPRHLTRLDAKVTAAGDLRLRLHAANRVTWFLGASNVAAAQQTIDLLAAWASGPRVAVDATSWSRSEGVTVSVPSDTGAPILWEPPRDLEDQFTAAFVDRQPTAEAGRAFGRAFARQVSDFLERSQDTARAHLADGWLDRAQARLDTVRRVADPSQQSRAGVMASQLAGDLHAVGFMALAPKERARRLFHALDGERQSLYGWEQALARLGISAPRGSGRYP